MFPSKTLARFFGIPGPKSAASIGYDEVFKGEASAPNETESGNNWLPGLRPVDYDVDSYFKAVFAGQVF